jgi:cyclophilin family peptidyl-prolyl cis-trans isomerase/HEAT repeat protein
MLRRKIAIGIVALVVGAGASLRAQSSSASPTRSEIGLYARLLSMADIRQLDMPLVDSALASTWSPLRHAATMAIGQVGPDVGRAGATRLMSLLGDRDATVAADAAYALGLLRDTSSIGALTKSLAVSAESAREAAWSLGEIGGSARTALVGGLHDAHGADVSIQLLLAAAKLRPIPLSDVEPYLKNADASVVWAAAYAIARNRAPAGVKDLIALAAAPVTAGADVPTHSVAAYLNEQKAPELIRAEIARGLAKNAAGDSLGPKAFEVLVSLTADADPHVRINAIRSIATYASAARPIVVKKLHDLDPNVRVAAAQSLGTVLGGGATDFAALWSADTSLVYRSSLLASAAQAGLRPPQLKALATSTDWRLRAAVASAEGDSLDRAFALSRALPLTRDPDPRVREAAYAAIVPSKSLPLEDSVHTLLIHGLADPDVYVRATILSALADRPSASDFEPVLASYNVAAKDSANDARLAAVQFLAALWKNDSAAIDETKRAQLARIPIPADPLERSAGKSIAPLKNWTNVRSAPKPIAWYENVVRSIVLPTAAGNGPRATIYTVRGPMRLELFGLDAPITVANFLSLARSDYYRNTRFHRVVPNFVAQDGDPRDDGNGGPGYAIRDEMNRRRYERGAVGMALSGPDTGGSQYFITHSPQPHLDGHYTVFGRVVSGFPVLDKIVQGDRIVRVEAQ